MTSMRAATGRSVAEGLDLFSSASLKTIARTLSVSPPADDRKCTIQALTPVIGTKRHLDGLDRHLSPDDWSLLDLVPVQISPFRIRLLLLALRERGLQDSAASATISRLLTMGCLLPVRTGYGQNKLSIEPQQIREWGMHAWFELAPSIREWARERDPLRHTLTPVPAPPALVGAALPELQRVAFILLGELAHSPVRITAQGIPNKTDMRRLAAALTSGENRGPKRKSASGPIPPLLYFALAVLWGANVLQMEGAALCPAAGADEFFTKPLAEQVRLLFLGWCHSLYDDVLRIPTLTFLYGGGDRVPWASEGAQYGERGDSQLLIARVALGESLARVTDAAPASWYRIDDLAGFVFHQYPEILFSRFDEYSLYYSHGSFAAPGQKPQRRQYGSVYRTIEGESASTPQDWRQRVLYQDTDWMEVEGAFVRQVLSESIRWLGLVEVGPDAAAPDRFRLTEIGQHVLLGRPLPEAGQITSGRPAIVQPNFEVVVVDATANLGLLAQLDAFAERRGLDRAATYQLTRPALVRGLDRGWTGQRILETLEAGNGGPLPQNVCYSLEEWIRLYEQLSLREAATLLEADDVAQLDRFLADPYLAPMLGKRLGPTTVLVHSHHTASVLTYVIQQTGELNDVDYAGSTAGSARIRGPNQIELKAEMAEPYMRYRLGAFSTLLKETRTGLVYQMSQETVARAVAAGWQGPQLIDFLTSATGEPLPDEFLVRLLGWSGAVPALSTETLIAVMLTSPSITWAILQRIPSIGRLIRALPSAQVALVAPADLEALRVAIGTRGLSLKEGSIAPDRLSPEPADLRSLLKQHRDDPQTVHDALKAAGLLGKLDKLRWGYGV